MSIMTFLHFTTKIASSFISALAVFVTFDISNQAKAIVVTGNPSNYLVRPGTGYDGVALLQINRTGRSVGSVCSGSLLPTGQHILTAAHCFTQNIDSEPLEGISPGQFNTGATLVGFESPNLPSNQRFEVISVNKFYIHPEWNGNYTNGNDIAIIELAQQASPEIDRYSIYQNADELGQVFTTVGYGFSGNGNTGATIPDFLKRSGQNVYDISLGNFTDAVNQIIPNSFSTPDAARERILGYDFDNGLVANDFFGYFGVPDTGLGINEVKTFSGDSGGPIFINNLVAGITSFNGTLGVVPPDVDSERNGSFGEFSFDTRVSPYVNYIDNVLAGNVRPTYVVPEPSTVLSSLLALGALVFNYRLRNSKEKSRKMADFLNKNCCLKMK